MPSAAVTLQVDLFGEVPDEPVPMRRSRVSNNPLCRNNSGTARGRRVNDLLRSYLRAMSNRSNCFAQADALRAAELTVAAEEVRADLLAGNGDANAVVRLENLAARAVRKLGLDPEQAKPRRTFADYAREKGARKAGNPGSGAAP